MRMISVATTHLVKSSDLNHHGTLFAGRSAEWFVEAGFLAAAEVADPQNIVCLNIHGLIFKKPVLPGQMLKFESKVVLSGRTTLVAYIKAETKQGFILDGFITFIHLNDDKKSHPHNIVIEPSTDDEKVLQERAKKLKTV